MKNNLREAQREKDLKMMGMQSKAEEYVRKADFDRDVVKKELEDMLSRERRGAFEKQAIYE